MNSESRNIQPPQIVVTGAAGFIGRRVVARLALAGAKVVAVDRIRGPLDFPPGVECRCCDLRKGLPNLAGDCVVVHLAWNMDRGNMEAQAASVSDFSRLLEQSGVRSLVALGSAEEYGELEGQLNEGMVPKRALHSFGRAKSEARKLLEGWSRGAGRKAIWLRPFIAYGPGQVGNMAIPYAVRCAKERIPAEFSAGMQFRDFVHVDDVAEGIAQAAIRLPDIGGAFTICNLGRGEPVRLRDVLERIALKTESQNLFKYGVRAMRPNEPQAQFADTSAALALLGWRAQIPWPEGIDELCREALR